MDKEAFLAPLPSEPVETSRGVVQVRGMSRAEALYKLGPCAEEDIEAMIIHIGLTDPALTFEEAKKWATTKGPEGGASLDVKAVRDKVFELSGGAPEQNLERPFREG